MKARKSPINRIGRSCKYAHPHITSNRESPHPATPLSLPRLYQSQLVFIINFINWRYRSLIFKSAESWIRSIRADTRTFDKDQFKKKISGWYFIWYLAHTSSLYIETLCDEVSYRWNRSIVVWHYLK